MKDDLIIRGGRVLDPATGVDEIRDVVIRGPRLAESSGDGQVIDAAGCLVIPGLVDFHTHIFRGGSALGLDPDLMIPQGTTAAVDAGTAGYANYGAFYERVVCTSRVRIRSFLNVGPGGQLTSGSPEDLDPAHYDISAMARVIDRYRDSILGLKVRLSRGIVPEETGADWLRAAVDLAEELDRRLGTRLRVAVHATDAPASAGEVAGCLRPGDVFVHCFHGVGNTILGEDGLPLPGVLRARERGVLFDAANGRGNFDMAVAEKALAAGFLPDIISSDLTMDKFNRPPHAKSLLLVMARYLGLGMPLPEVIRRVTAAPAAAMGLAGETGTLRPGARADVAVLRLEEHPAVLRDAAGRPQDCRVIPVPVMTVCGGEVLYCQPDFWL